METKRTLTNEETLQLAKKLQEFDDLETIKKSSTDALFSVLRGIGKLEANAYKDYRIVRIEEIKVNTAVYQTKSTLLGKIADELNERGEDVGYNKGVLYFREKGTGIQLSYHTRINWPKFNNKAPEWDRVQDAWSMTMEEYDEAKRKAQKAYSDKVAAFNEFKEDIQESIFKPYIKAIDEALSNEAFLEEMEELAIRDFRRKHGLFSDEGEGMSFFEEFKSKLSKDYFLNAFIKAGLHLRTAAENIAAAENEDSICGPKIYGATDIMCTCNVDMECGCRVAVNIQREVDEHYGGHELYELLNKKCRMLNDLFRRIDEGQ